MYAVPIPPFNPKFKKYRFGSTGSRVETYVLQFNTAFDDLNYLKTPLSYASVHGYTKKGNFIPAGTHMIAAYSPPTTTITLTLLKAF